MQNQTFARVLTCSLIVVSAVLIAPVVAQTPTTVSQSSTLCVSGSPTPSTTVPTTTSTTPTSSGIIPPITSSSTTPPPTTTSSSPSPTLPPCPSPTRETGNNTTAALEGEGSPSLALPIVVAGVLASFVMMRRRQD